MRKGSLGIGTEYIRISCACTDTQAQTHRHTGTDAQTHRHRHTDTDTCRHWYVPPRYVMLPKGVQEGIGSTQDSAPQNFQHPRGTCGKQGGWQGRDAGYPAPPQRVFKLRVPPAFPRG